MARSRTPEPPLQAIRQAAELAFNKTLRGKTPIPAEALSRLKPSAAGEEAGSLALFRLLTSSLTRREGLAGVALKDLPGIVDEWVRRFPRIPELLHLSRAELLNYLKKQILNVQSNAASISEFSKEKYLKGLMKSIVGKAVFERLIKSSLALRLWFQESATQALRVFNSELATNRTLQYVDGRGVGVTLTPFNRHTRIERIVTELHDGTTKEFTDLTFLASNRQGYQTFSSLVEIKMSGVAPKATEQFGQFLTRVASAKRVIGYTEDGSLVQIDTAKLIMDPLLVNRIVVTHPKDADWCNVTGQQQVGLVTGIDMKATGKGGDLDMSERTQGAGGLHYRKLFYWKVTVAVKSDWLEYPVKALLGLLPPPPK